MSHRVSIIAYHALDEGPGPICMPAKRFERQVRALHEAGCVALTLGQVVEHVQAGRPFPERSIALTFDDGYRSVHRTALPLLAELGFPATVFPVTGHLGGHNAWDAASLRAPELPLVTEAELGELVSAGWEVGGHTHTHRALPSLCPDEVMAELERSRAVLEDLSGCRVRTFAFPYGCYDDTSRALAAASHDACLVIGAARASLASALDRLERVDACYLGRHWQLRSLLRGRAGDAYLAVRRLGRAAGALLRHRARP
jgi:peptidoglycan/xylan/chitin deacetylase (PgdA/CDA1 family)